jgi:hypothetical protein
MEHLCSCGMPDKWTMDPSFPVVFDVATNEYAVLHGPNQRVQAVMRYCFWCGGALPESKRDTFFTAPDPAEVTAMKRILARLGLPGLVDDRLGHLWCPIRLVVFRGGRLTCACSRRVKRSD